VTGHRARIADALRAVSMISPASFAWFGRPSRPLPPDLLADVGSDVARASLLEALQGELYRSFFTQGRPVPESPVGRVPPRPHRGFLAALSAANAGQGGWEPGWQLLAREADAVIVAKEGIAVRARGADCRIDGRATAPGAPVRVRRPKELEAVAPGFYTALGDRLPATAEEVRVYFHATAAGAVPLMAACTRVLNAAGVPFVLKVVDRPGGFTRCDAGVLYLESGGFAGARPAVARIVAVCAPHLRAAVPAFTQALAPGVAVAEHEPDRDASFGTARCRLLAEGLVGAHEAGAARLGDRLEAVVRTFAGHDVDIDRPYLSPGSVARYAL
jgi:hypothetical protein